MLVELDEAPNARERWRFTVGCTRASATITVREILAVRGHGGGVTRTIVLSAIGASVALAAYGLVRYSELRSGAGNWMAFAVFLVVVCAYAACALALSRGTTHAIVVARRNGLIGGFAVGAGWLVVLVPTATLKSFVFVPLAIALLVPAGVAFLTVRGTGDAKAATGAALWSGLVGGLLIFIVWVATTYVRNGRPYDRQLIRDFHRSNAHDLAAYAVSDNLGAGLTLLVIVPVVALAIGSLARPVRTNTHWDDPPTGIRAE